MPAIGEKLRQAATRLNKERTAPVWMGPSGAGPQGGVTQSMIGRYLCCKERFRLYVVEGLKPADAFSAPLEFGNMWHACEEAQAANKNWAVPLQAHADNLKRRFPFQRPEIEQWHDKCAGLFPLYLEHWENHPDEKERVPLEQEQLFDVAYSLPSGRTVRLRGKRDSSDLIGKGKNAGVYLKENKTKSTIDTQAISRQCGFDLQTMLYMITLRTRYDQAGWAADGPLRGVRYNVVRRSAHKGGKKQTAVESMLEKFNEDKADKRIGEWFARWKIEISDADVARFKMQMLDPVLENLCDDWEWWRACDSKVAKIFETPVWDYERRAKTFSEHQSRHFRLPFGIYNVVAEGGSSDLDNYMDTGSEAGLQRTDNLFPELAA